MHGISHKSYDLSPEIFKNLLGYVSVVAYTYSREMTTLEKVLKT